MCIRGLGFCPQFYSSLKILRLFKPIYTRPQLHFSLVSTRWMSPVSPHRNMVPSRGPGTTNTHHPGHQLFSIIASQWIKLINIQTRWLLHPIFWCCCECVRSSSLDIGSVHMIPTCYNMALVLFHTFSFFYYKHVDILIVCCIYVVHISTQLQYTQTSEDAIYKSDNLRFVLFQYHCIYIYFAEHFV